MVFHQHINTQMQMVISYLKYLRESWACRPLNLLRMLNVELIGLVLLFYFTLRIYNFYHNYNALYDIYVIYCTKIRIVLRYMSSSITWFFYRFYLLLGEGWCPIAQSRFVLQNKWWSNYLSIYRSIYMSVCLCVCPSVCLSVHTPAAKPTIHPSSCLFTLRSSMLNY